MVRWSMACLLALFMGAWTAVADAKVPVRQKDLDTWWTASKRMWLGEDAYQAAGTHFTDGVCTADLEEGIIIPVYTGRPPLSERVIGVLFVGKGSLSVDFPHRGDAWSFSNHMVNRANKTPGEMQGVAREGKPYEVGITRAMILSADPQVEYVLLEKMPVGSGVFRTTKGEDSYDKDGKLIFSEEYVVTESRGKLKAKMISTNMLSQRTLRLEEAGLDPIAMLRQDRMLHEEFEFPGEHLRAIADFRTDDRFHVASLDGAGIGPQDYDQWLTCFRDGLGQSDIGGRSIVFAHGEDLDGKRHLRRMAGGDFERSKDQAVGRPEVMMEPVHADTKVEIRPVNRRNYMQVNVDSLLTVRAKGATLQHVAISLPTERAVKDSYQLMGVWDENDKPLARVGLHSDNAFFVQGSGDATAETASTAIDEGAAAEDVTQMELPTIDVGGVGLGGGGSGASDTVEGDAGGEGSTSEDLLGEPLEMQVMEQETLEYMLVEESPFRYEILVLLPKPVPAGETTKIRVKWQAKWRYSNMTFSGRQMGATTGVRGFLPELLPAPGGTAWDTTTTFGIPPQGLFPMGGAVTGDTIDEWRSDDGWRWVKAESTASRKASIGVGKWIDHKEPGAENMPGVRVHLLTNDAFGIQQFPPEVRRVVSFLQRFMPDLDPQEIELIQGPGMLPTEAVRLDFRSGRSGLIILRNLKSAGGVASGETSELSEKYKHLAQTQIARQVAHQYWGQRTRPNTSSDRWVVDALADAFGAFYVRAGLGVDTYTSRIDVVRKRLEDPTERTVNKDLVNRRRRSLSLTTPAKLSDVGRVVRDDYGFFLIAHSLRLRIGDMPFFVALDRLSQRRQDGWVTTEDLQSVFEETSGQDLSDFFDFWIRAGNIPEVTVEVREEQGAEGTTVHGCVISDQPFGSFDLPIRVTDQAGERIAEARVDVDDGRGVFTVPGRTGEVSVEVDPEGLLVMYGRKVKSVEQTLCDVVGTAAP